MDYILFSIIVLIVFLVTWIIANIYTLQQNIYDAYEMIKCKECKFLLKVDHNNQMGLIYECHCDYPGFDDETNEAIWPIIKNLNIGCGMGLRNDDE